MQGEVVYLYAFDVASEIVTARILEVMSKRPEPAQIRRDRSLPKDVPLYRPLRVGLPPLVSSVGGAAISVVVRIYEVGVVTVEMREPFTAGDLRELHGYHNPTDASGTNLDDLAQLICRDVCNAIPEALIGPSSPRAPEAYTVFCVTSIDGAAVASWMRARRRDIAGLLTETPPERLSDEQVAEVLRIGANFEVTDQVVIDWDAALVVDLTGYVDDVVYVLELANLQLEEFRVMDERLDAYLNRAYVDVESRRLSLFRLNDPVLRSLRSFRVDVAKLADEVTHISKLIGDWYLARVYLGARDRFYLNEWRRSVEDRVTQLDSLYSVFQADVNDRRMLLLETLIVLLFLVDIIALFVVRR